MTDTRLEFTRVNGTAEAGLGALQAERTADMFRVRTPSDGRTAGELPDPTTDHSKLPRNVGEAHQLIAGGPRSDAQRTLAEATGMMGTEGVDPKEAIKTAGPKFMQAIDQADQALGTVSTNLREVMQNPELRQQFGAKMRADMALEHAISNLEVPERLQGKITREDLQTKISALAQAYMLTKPGEDLSYRGLEADLKKFPEVFGPLERSRQIGQSEPYRTFNQHSEQYPRALADAVLTRLGAFEGFNSAGQQLQAWEHLRSAMKLLGQDLPEDPPGFGRA